MAPLRYGAIVNIVTLVVFFIYLCVSLYLIARQGLGRSMPWIWLTLLAICRLTQVSLDLYATTTNPPDTAPNTSLESGVDGACSGFCSWSIFLLSFLSSLLSLAA
jgi:hypothetical protein